MATDPIIAAIRSHLSSGYPIHHHTAVAVMLAILNLDPLASHRQVVLTIAKTLGVASEWGAESYEAMPEQMRGML